MREFQASDWLQKFRMTKETFFLLCGKLKPRLSRQDTRLRPALPLEKRVAVALWRLASNVEYRTISALFGVGRSTVCKCVRDVCHAIVLLLRPLYLRSPERAGAGGRGAALLLALGLPSLRGSAGQPPRAHHRPVQQHAQLLEQPRLAVGGHAGRGERARAVLGRVRRVPGQHRARRAAAELHALGSRLRGVSTAGAPLHGPSAGLPDAGRRRIPAEELAAEELPGVRRAVGG